MIIHVCTCGFLLWLPEVDQTSNLYSSSTMLTRLHQSPKNQRAHYTGKNTEYRVFVSIPIPHLDFLLRGGKCGVLHGFCHLKRVRNYTVDINEFPNHTLNGKLDADVVLLQFGHGDFFFNLKAMVFCCFSNDKSWKRNLHDSRKIRRTWFGNQEE